jgi:DeoR family transcriptional regulator, deoxyribose operon repressor
MAARKQQRCSTLLEQVQKKGRLSLKKAADQLQVSEMTIRRDVAASGGRLSALGGYILADQPSTPYALEREHDANRAAKALACQYACSLIEPEDTLFLDCGTTMPHLAERLPDDLDLTVVCYALNVAEILARKRGIRMVLMGGLYHASSASFEGESGLAILKSIRLNKAFISAGGVHVSRGISCSNFHEVPVKRIAMENALSSFLVVDSSKFGKLKPAYFAEQAAFEAMITESGIGKESSSQGLGAALMQD